MTRYQNDCLSETEDEIIVVAKPNKMTAAQAIHTIRVCVLQEVDGRENWHCADYYTLRQERDALRANKESYDNIHVDLQRLEI